MANWVFGEPDDPDEHQGGDVLADCFFFARVVHRRHYDFVDVGAEDFKFHFESLLCVV